MELMEDEEAEVKSNALKSMVKHILKIFSPSYCKQQQAIAIFKKIVSLGLDSSTSVETKDFILTKLKKLTIRFDNHSDSELFGML
jgi:hypothetical protein